MSKKYFGTDGVRGLVGKDPMTADFALRLASAAAQVLVPAGGIVLIGKDTRLSGYMFESALEAGFTAAGADVLLVGPLPTPGVAYLTQEFSADLGVVISASHNLYYDNGIKFFDGSGSKLSDDVEKAIEDSLDKAAITVDSQSLGKAQRIDSALVRYERWGQRRRLQSRAASAGEPRCRSHPDRVLPQRPQYQRRLRLHQTRLAAAHGPGRECRHRYRNRRGWRSRGSGGRERPAGGW
jgi:hypothetical protein